MIAPTLQGPNVTLRHPVAADFEAYWAFSQSPRAQYVDAVPTIRDAWFGFTAEAGSWHLYGMGSWSIEVDGALAGNTGTLQPAHFPEVEIGWILYDGFEGRGLAFEAARLVLDYTWAQIKPPSLVSYIDPHNARSRALASKLGAALDPDAQRPEGESAEDTVVYRHRRPA